MAQPLLKLQAGGNHGSTGAFESYGAGTDGKSRDRSDASFRAIESFQTLG
jgi:hypothetical protein